MRLLRRRVCSGKRPCTLLQLQVREEYADIAQSISREGKGGRRMSKADFGFGTPLIRWAKTARVFLVDYGHVHMALSPRTATALSNALLKAVDELPPEERS